MNLRIFYESNGVDYDTFLQRLRGKEALVEKYIRIFMADSTYDELAEAISARDYEAAGFKAHALKGISLNLNLEKLSALCEDMVSSSRAGDTQAMDTLFERVKAEYSRIMEELGE